MPLEHWPPAEALLGLEIPLLVFIDARQHERQGRLLCSPLNKNDLVPFSTNRNVVQDIKPPPIHDEGKG